MEPDKIGISEFIKKYTIKVFNNFQCPQDIDPLLFSELCVYYYTDVRPAVVSEVIEGDCIYTESITTNLDGEVVKKNTIYFNSLLDGPVGIV